MRNFQYLLISFCIILFISCETTPKKIGNFKLLPIPQEFNIEGVSNLELIDIKNGFSENSELPVLNGLLKNISIVDKNAQAQIFFEIDSSLNIPNEGYSIVISSTKIEITGKDKAGLFYAFQTLEQLLQDAKDQNVNLPVCSIKDYPLLSYRAIQLDIKHHLEKLDYYYDLLDKLASYKVNAIIVEMEDKIKYEKHPKIASLDAISIPEWIKLSEYAKDRNIEISPLIQGLGHASFVLKHEGYKYLRDDLKSDWAFNPLNSDTYELQFDLYREAINATPNGKYLHIGGDEVHTTGRNSGKTALELQLTWLEKVCKFAEKNNRIPIFWDDMPLKHANVYSAMFNTKLSQVEVDEIWKENEHKLLEFLDKFPKNCIYMRWNYSASEALGNEKAMQWFKNHGMKVMGATAGQTRWVLMPQEESNMNNIKSFTISSIKNNLNGLLLTLWDDDSPHFELYNRGIISFAEYSWAGNKRSKKEIKSAYRQREFSSNASPDEFAFIDQLEKPVAFWKNALLHGNSRNLLKANKNAIDEVVISLPNKNNKGEWSKKYAKRLEIATKTLKSCDSVTSKILDMKSKALRNKYSLEVYEQVNKLVKFSLESLLNLKSYDLAENKEQETEALLNIKMLPEEFKKLRMEFELVYGKTRILAKPESYILDQDHHSHLANQSISFDWQFLAEILFLEKIEMVYE